MATREPDAQQLKQIDEALAAGQNIEAIKIYREATGKGLREAKEFIECLIPRLQELDPKKYAALRGEISRQKA